MRYYILYFYYILQHFQPIAKKQYISLSIHWVRAAADVSSACSNYSLNDVQVTIWTICDILMKIPILKNTDKLYLKFHWWLFIMKSGFYIMHIIYRTFCLFKLHSKTKMSLLGNLLPDDMLSEMKLKL